MLEGLIIDPQLKFISVLHHTQAILSDGEWEQESALVPKSISIKIREKN